MYCTLYPLEIQDERDNTTVEETNMQRKNSEDSDRDSDIEIRCVTDSDIPNIL